ncbi:MAG: hypothetical protein ABI634_18745 [Acidobacteriota bacterium]
MLTSRLFIVAQQVVTAAESAREFSQSMTPHAMTSPTHGPLDMTLVVLGGGVVIVTTIYSLLYLIRPGERSAEHVKYRILEDGRGESQ